MIKIAMCCMVADGRNTKEEFDKEIDEKAGDKEQALFFWGEDSTNKGKP